jgi:hypothetical protein
LLNGDSVNSMLVTAIGSALSSDFGFHMKNIAETPSPMRQRAMRNPGMADQFPPRLIETVNKLVRTARQMLTEIGREPTTEELAEKLSMPVEKVAKLLDIAGTPIKIDAR